MSNNGLFSNQGDPESGKRTILFVVVSLAIFGGFYLVQSLFFPQKPTTSAAPQTTQQSVATQQPEAAPAIVSGAIDGSKAYVEPVAPMEEGAEAVDPTVVSLPLRDDIRIETDKLVAIFTNKGGELRSLELKAHSDGDKKVNLFLAGDKTIDGMSVSFGPAGTPKISTIMQTNIIDSKTVEFVGTFPATVAGKDGPVPVKLTKRYQFRDGEYMFLLSVSLENEKNKSEPIPAAVGGVTYTLNIGPQIGPAFEGNQARGEYRKFFYYMDGKKNEVKAGTSGNQYVWTSIVGKYFAFSMIPSLDMPGPTFMTTYGNPPMEKVGTGNTISLSRGVFTKASVKDDYYFYFGPKTYDDMGKYNVVDRNGFARQNLNLQDAIDNGSWLPWLEDILKWCLMALYAVLPNYGIAIILLTLIVKLLTFPLTKKSSEAQVRMQAFQPKIQELQAKYKGDPQKLNQEMAALYQKEGYNPLSGCLPILIQIPLFFAMYSLFNNHFDLRGAMFIPGWIPDLSQAEFVWAFEPINFVIWKLSAIRLLPIIYLGSQLIYGKMTQQPTGQSAGQMKFMMYGMPVLFFFMLYDVPSGLLVYWIASNMFQVGQQLIIKKFMGKGNDSGGMKKVGETVLQGKKGKK